MNYPIVAIVGEPNVGKSTLLNKISGQRHAVTSPIEGTTRDRQYVDTIWSGVPLTMVDTAGLSRHGKEGLEASLAKQIQVAIDEADVIVLVVDGKGGINSVDRQTLVRFRKIEKPTLLVINKIDSPKNREISIAEFSALGIKKIFPLSSVTGQGIGDMLDAVVAELVNIPEETKPEVSGIAVGIVGKPNVGKSSLLNSILGSERVVVSPIPGTTRTAIDTEWNFEGQDYTFIDTAGLKRKDHRQSLPDIYSTFQTFRAIRRSDVCILVVDASDRITSQDQRIAEEIFNQKKGLILVANKVDLIQGEDKVKKVRDVISANFPFLWMCPLVFVSALNGDHVDEVLKSIKPIFDARHKVVTEEVLKEFINYHVKHHPPQRLKDQKIPKVFGLVQTETNPPEFTLKVNYPAAFSDAFRKYILGNIMRELGFWGTPVSIKLFGKDKK